LRNESVEVENTESLQPGTPVMDHWSCHQVRRKNLEDLGTSKNVAVVIPFREQTGQERHRELAKLFETLLPYAQQAAQSEGVTFRFFVVEQNDDGHFNRGALMDVGFQQAQAYFGSSFTVIAHDCDFVPDEKMIQWYTRRGDGPIHLASYVYCPALGGVTIFCDDQYSAMDGYSHSMWGWGGEDDDAMDRWMSDPNRIIIAPNGNERFKDLGKSEDKARDRTVYDKSMQVWKKDNQDQNWVREGLAGLKYSVLSTIPNESPLVEHSIVEL
jgi:hypothetical protein